jgi:hypothetical protein
LTSTSFLVNCLWFEEVIFQDYIRVILNVNRTTSTWSLVPTGVVLKALLLVVEAIPRFELAVLVDLDELLGDPVVSYLDLSPIYGNNQAEQDKIRTHVQGEIYPDVLRS